MNSLVLPGDVKQDAAEDGADEPGDDDQEADVPRVRAPLQLTTNTNTRSINGKSDSRRI